MCLKCKRQGRSCVTGGESGWWQSTSSVTGCVSSDSLHMAELLGWVCVVQPSGFSQVLGGAGWALASLAWWVLVLKMRREDGIGQGKWNPATAIKYRDTMADWRGPWAGSGWRMKEYPKAGCCGFGYCCHWYLCDNVVLEGKMMSWWTTAAVLMLFVFGSSHYFWS